MKGVGVNNGGGKTTSSTNVTNCFCTPITTRGGGSGIGVEDGGGGGIRLNENGRGRIGLVEDVGGGIGAEDGRGNVDGGKGGEGGGEDGGGRGHEDGMVQIFLPLGTCEDTRGTTRVCFISLGFLVEALDLAPYTMQNRLNCF
jgi:hypothetical protein